MSDAMTSVVQQVAVPAGGMRLDADLTVPAAARGVVLFAHGSGSSRHSPRNRAVAGLLQHHGHATVLVDLLTAEEERADMRDAQLRFDIALLADRLVDIVDWLGSQPHTAELPLGLFGASTGAAAALVAAARRPDRVRAVVSRGGRADLAGEALSRVRAPTLLLVGERDQIVVDLNRQAVVHLAGVALVRLIPQAGHLFEEAGTLDEVARQAAAWFDQHLTTR